MPVVIVPLCASLIVGGIMFMFLGRPLGSLTTAMFDGLNSMNDGSKIVLGIVLGLKAKTQIRESAPGTYSGEGFATAGIIIGIVGLAALAIYLLIVVITVASG